MSKKIVSFLMEEDKIAKLDELAWRERTSRSQFLRDCIREKISQAEEKP